MLNHVSPYLWRFFTTHCACCNQPDSIGVHVMGGRNLFTPAALDSNWAYAVDDTWLTKTSLTSARRSLMGEQIGGEGYLFGGRNTAGTQFSTTEQYSPGSDSFASLTSMSVAGSQGTANSDGTDAFVVRGFETATSTANHDMYDVSGDSWSAKTSVFEGATQNFMLMAGFSFSSGKCHSLGGQYVAGGGAVTTLNKQYDVAGNSWTNRTAFTSARARAMGESDGGAYGYLWCGGTYAGASAVKDMRRYDLSGNSWSNLTAPTQFMLHGGGAYDGAGQLYSMGGADRDAPTTINAYRYDISGAAWSTLTNLPGQKDETVGMGGLL